MIHYYLKNCRILIINYKQNYLFILLFKNLQILVFIVNFFLPQKIENIFIYILKLLYNDLTS